ncbi:tetratricopeptide repeat protein [Caminibacter sp.]
MKKIISLFLVTFLFAGSLNIKEIYEKSYNYEKMGDYKDAIKVLIPLLEKFPSGYTLNLRIAYLFFLNKNYKNAIKYYEKASLILPYSLEPKLGLSRVYLAMGAYDKAINVANTILKTDYYNFYGNYYLALAFYYKKDYKKALAVTNKMLTLYPTSILYLTLLGEIYWNIDKKTAVKIFNDLLILDPNNVVAKSYLKK